MVVATSKEGKERRLIYNQNILLKERNDTLKFRVKDDELKFDITFKFIFTDEGDGFKTTSSIENMGREISIILHNWNDPIGVETTNPFEYTLNVTNKTIWVRFKTSSVVNQGFRNFHLSIWGEI